MRSTRITRIYANLSHLFAEQRKSLLSAASVGFNLQDRDKFEDRHARIVRLYQELARLNPEAYENAVSGRATSKERSSSQRVA
jgi:hypothetical protein